MSGRVSRRAARGHPWGSMGWVRRLTLQLAGLRVAEREGISLPWAFPGGFTHNADWRFNETLMMCFAAFLTILTGNPSIVHLKAATFGHRKAWNNSWVGYTSYSQTLVGVRILQLSKQSYLQAVSMETDRSAAVSPLLCVNLCLHSIEPWLNMARLEL